MAEDEDTEKRAVKCDFCGQWMLMNENECKPFMQITCPKCGEHGRAFYREMVK